VRVTAPDEHQLARVGRGSYRRQASSRSNRRRTRGVRRALL
jgi:hypothetical protein